MESTRYTDTAAPRRHNRGSIVGPIILIALGVLFLGQTMGWLSPSIWTTLLGYWPVLLILIGLELILGRGSWVGALVVGAVVVGIVSVLGVVGTMPWTVSGANFGAFTPVETVTLAEEMGQARRATYQLDFGAGSLNVSALPVSSGNLIDATLERDERAAIDRNVDRQGDLARVTIRGRNVEPVSRLGTTGRTRMTVYLSPKIPGEVRVNGGAGELNVDLSAIQATYFELNAGVGGTKITLPQSAGRMNAKVNVGVGGVEITAPEGVALQVRVDKGIGGVTVDTSRFPKVGDETYRSSNYDSATNRVDLYVSGGVGGITIN